MRRTTRYALAAAILAATALTVMAGAWFLQPARVTLGVVDGRRPETEIVRALERNAGRAERPLRVQTRSYPDTAALKAAFERGEVAAAPFDTSEAIPAVGRTVAVLGRRQLLVLGISERAAEIESGRARIALVAGSPEAQRSGQLLLGLIVGADVAQKAERLELGEALRRLQARRLDFVAFSDSEAVRRLREALRSMRGEQAPSWTLLPVSEAERIAGRNPEAEASTVAAGDLRADPALPDDEVTVLSTTTRLFARDEVPDAAVAALARAVITERGGLARIAPAAARIEAPTTDRAAPLPTHPDVIAYLEGNELSFFDRYGDLFYIGLFGVSGVGSAIAGLATWRESRRRRRDLLRLLELRKLIHEAGEAGSRAELDTIFARYREAMDLVMGIAGRMRYEEADLNAIMVAALVFRDTMQQRRADLGDKTLPQG